MNKIIFAVIFVMIANVPALAQGKIATSRDDNVLVVLSRRYRDHMNYQDTLFNQSVIDQIHERGCALYKKTIYDGLISNSGVKHLSKVLLAENKCVEEILIELDLEMPTISSIRSLDRVNYPVSMVVRELSIEEEAYKTLSNYIYSSDYIFNWDNELKRTTNKTIIRHLLRDFLLKDPERLRRERKRFSLFFNRKHRSRLKIIEGIMTAD